MQDLLLLDPIHETGDEGFAEASVILLRLEFGSAAVGRVRGPRAP